MSKTIVIKCDACQTELYKTGGDGHQYWTIEPGAYVFPRLPGCYVPGTVQSTMHFCTPACIVKYASEVRSAYTGKTWIEVFEQQTAEKATDDASNRPNQK